MAPATLEQMLASCLVKDKTSGEVLGINLIEVDPTKDCDCEPILDCDLTGIDPEILLLANAFGVDECGRVGLKVVKCKTT